MTPRISSSTTSPAWAPSSRPRSNARLRLRDEPRRRAALATLEDARQSTWSSPLEDDRHGGSPPAPASRRRRPAGHLLTAHGTVRSAVEAMRRAPSNYVTKQLTTDDSARASRVGLAMAPGAREPLAPAGGGEPVRTRRVIAESARSRSCSTSCGASRRAVRGPDQGESGRKGVVARLVHFWSDRVGRPFVAINCKASPKAYSSELFGTRRRVTGAGARAAASSAPTGRARSLDEIGEVSIDFQAKLCACCRPARCSASGQRPACGRRAGVARTNRVCARDRGRRFARTCTSA